MFARVLSIAALAVSRLLPPPCFSSPQTEVGFSPDRGATELVVKTIEGAHHTIRVAAYSFTSAPIAKALVAASKQGIDVRNVRMVADKSNATVQYTAATFLANQGVPVRLDYRYAIMHDKFIVVDGATVELGSFNFTAAAEKHNAENVLVLRDPAVAERYAAEWERLWRESEVIPAVLTR
jgi:phosphatidylserine/phosphatidylglycerophosphate/cardiolipin synthase-like enzyme